MTAFLATIYSAEKNELADSAKFFDDETEMKILADLVKKRECPTPGFPSPSCDANLFFGFFFDGTNNHMERDVPFHSHSNVARLYRAFPGGKDTHGSDARLCNLDMQLTVSCSFNGLLL
jgi:hypothetical protein